MADNNEQVQAVDSTEEQGKNLELQKLENDVNNLVDENSENNPEKLSVTLTTEFVKSIPADTAKSMLKLIKGKYQNGVPPQLTDLVTVLNSIVIKPNINTGELTNTGTGGEMYKKNLDTGENMEEMINSIKTKINKTMTSIDNFPDNQELNKAKGALETIGTIIDNPNSDNTKSLQKFILNNLPPKSDDYKTFLKENFGPKGAQQKDPYKPDGYFGKNTIKGIDSCLTRLNNYIEEITKAKSIQEKANQEANKPDGVPTGNVDTRVDDLSTNVDYQALQSLSKLIESSQALLNNPEKFNKLLENDKINQDLVNSLKNDSDKVMEFAISLEKYESIGQINNMVKDRSNKNNKLNDVKGKIEEKEKELGNYTEESEDDATTNQITLEINNLKKQEEQLKAEMDALYLKIANAKWDYQVTMIRKDEIEKQLMDGMSLMIDYTKKCVTLINQMLDVLDSEGEETGDNEMKKALIDFKDSLLTTSGLVEVQDENGNTEIEENKDAPQWARSKYKPTLSPADSENLNFTATFFNECMKDKLPNGDKAARMDIEGITYTVNVDKNGNICPTATASDGSNPIMLENCQPCIKYLQNKAIEAGLDVEIARNNSMKDYVLRSHGCGITIEPITIAGERVSNDLSTCLKLLNLTNYIRSKGEPDLKYKYSTDEKENKYLIIRGSRGKQTISLSNFGLNGIADEELKKFIKYNNHEERNDDWDKDWNKKKSSDYKRITL